MKQCKGEPVIISGEDAASVVGVYGRGAVVEVNHVTLRTEEELM